mgnify:CR=1 FL=1|jgi:hypothetical protein
MKVVSYYNVVPNKNKSQEKFDILTKFIQGVNAAGDTGIVHKGYDLQKCDVGMIQGWQHEVGKNAPHLQLRQRVMQRTANKRVCTADANLFLYANKTNHPHHYLRYSFDGVFPNTGEYFDNNPNPKRWQQISKHLNISLEQPKLNGKNIVICLQRNQGWSMGKLPVVQWLENVILEIKKYSDRKIVIRPHPGDKKAIIHYLPQLMQKYKHNPSIKISSAGTPLEQDLQKAWAVVNHNSSSIVGPLIQGYPGFITDSVKSQCAEVSHNGFSQLENPQQFDRQQWLERISMLHWNFEELENGTAWRHMRQYVNS